MHELRENILEFLSTTFKVIVLLIWHFLIEILFSGKEGIGIRVKLTVVIIDGHEGCWVRLWVELREEGGAIVGHGILIGGDVKAKSGREGRRELMNSLVLLMSLIAQGARGTGGTEIVITDVDIRCRCTADRNEGPMQSGAIQLEFTRAMVISTVIDMK